MEKVAQLKKQMTVKMALLYAVLLGVMLLQGNLTAAYGLTFGTVMAFLNFYLLAGTLERSLRMNPQKARVFVTSHYLLRYALFFLILLTAMQRADMDFLWAVCGLLIPKAVIYGGNFYDLLRRRSTSGKRGAT